MRGTIRIRHGKGDKFRAVPMSATAIAAVEAWLRVRGPLARDSESALFVALRTGQRLGYQGVLEVVKRWTPPGTTPHALRHSFATHLLRRGCDLMALRDMLGHASVATTERYVHLDAAHVRQAYESAHPRARREP